MNTIEKTLQLYNEFKSEHDGKEPAYATVKIDWDANERTIKLDLDNTKSTEEDPEDDEIFYYADGINELLFTLLPSDTHDFTVTEVLEFHENVNLNPDEFVWAVNMDWVCDGNNGNVVLGGGVYKDFEDALHIYNNAVEKEKRTSWIKHIDQCDGDYYIDEEIFSNGQEREFCAYKVGEHLLLHTTITLYKHKVY